VSLALGLEKACRGVVRSVDTRKKGGVLAIRAVRDARWWRLTAAASRAVDDGLFVSSSGMLLPIR